MRAHIVLAHPEVKSFNAHLSGISKQVLDTAGYKTTLSDLYAMDFDPREGPHHYSSRKDAEVFHAQTEQRFSAENETLPPEVNSEIHCLLESDLFFPPLCQAGDLSLSGLRHSEKRLCQGPM